MKPTQILRPPSRLRRATQKRWRILRLLGSLLPLLLLDQAELAAEQAGAQPSEEPKAAQSADPATADPATASPATADPTPEEAPTPKSGGLFQALQPQEQPSQKATKKDPSSEEMHAQQTAQGEALADLDIVELFQRAGEVEKELDGLQESLEVPATVQAVQKELPRTVQAVLSETATAMTRVKEAHRWFVISDIRFFYSERARELEERQTPLLEFAKHVSAVPKRVEALSTEWGHAQKVLREVGASAQAQERVKQLLKKAQLTGYLARRTETGLARSSALFEEMNRAIRDVLDLADLGPPTVLETIDHRGFTPWRAALNLPDYKSAQQEIVRSLKWNLNSLGIFAKNGAARLGLHLLALCLLFGILIKTRRDRIYAREHADEIRAQADAERAADEPPPLPVDDRQYSLDFDSLQHPIACTAIFGSVISIFIYKYMPASVGAIVLSTAVLSSAWLQSKKHSSHGPYIAVGAVLLNIILMLHMATSNLQALDTLLQGLEGVTSWVLIQRLRKSPPDTLSGAWSSVFEMGLRVWLFALAIGAIAWLSGFDITSIVLINATARLLLITLAFIGLYEVTKGLLNLFVNSPVKAHLRTIRDHGQLVEEKLALVLRWLLLFYWGKIFLNSYTIYAPLRAALSGMMQRKFDLGSLSISLGSIMTLGVGAVIAVLTAQLIRFFLTEEILPRTSLRIGSRAAITTGSYAILLGFGIFTTLAAAGVQLDKLTILVSAFGVGIGFGLQNIVQNFVSGLILLFGRPVNVGDTVQVDDLLGSVSSIGFRASTVRTFRGAEVIVPNSAFVTDKVINWTLSDDKRRVEINLGVAYGTDPERVLKILRDVAIQNENCMRAPEPDALFLEFGDSSLNFQLRAWTATGANRPTFQSELTVAIAQALKEADIEIPFPQRDLHLKSFDEEAVQRLTGKSE
ncbi:MAG: mechanosensitive ion channel [Polyangiaceae bacterium]|nr:mechanosensitive ion channel [Polyangiaceae bacterium]